MRPAHGIAIDIDHAQCNKRNRERHAKAFQKLLPARGIPREDRAHGESGRHNTDPGQHEISGREICAAEREQILLMQNIPEPGCAAEALSSNSVQQVMQCDHGHAEDDKQAHGKMDEGRQNNHAEADCPDHQQDHEISAPADLKKHDEAEHSELQEYKPNTASHEQAREFALRMMPAIHPEECAHASSKNKYRRTKMGDPASEEDGGGGACKVGG